MERPPDPAGPTPLRLLDLGSADPITAQTFVEAVAPSVASGASPPTLVIAVPASAYVSLGFHQSYDEELDAAVIRRRGLPVVRRVTGGGTTWLDPAQLFYELVAPLDGPWPSEATAFERFLGPPRRALAAFGIDARWRPPSDLVVGGRKISGNAGGEWEGAAILQGGLLGGSDTDAMVEILRSPHPAFRDLLAREVRAHLTSVAALLGRRVGTEELRAALLDAYRRDPAWRIEPGSPTPVERARFAEEVSPRHGSPSWQRIPPAPGTRGGPFRRVRVAGSRYLVGAPDPDVPNGIRISVEEEGRVAAEYRAGPAPGYRGPDDLTRLL